MRILFNPTFFTFIIILCQLAYHSLKFAVDSAEDGYLQPYFKKKGGIDATEDALSTSKYGIALSDGVSMNTLPTGHFAAGLCYASQQSFAEFGQKKFRHQEWSHEQFLADIDLFADRYVLKSHELNANNKFSVPDLSVSATLVAAYIDNSESREHPLLRVVQKGDSQLVVFRKTANPLNPETVYYEPIFVSPIGQSRFNCPYQFVANILMDEGFNLRPDQKYSIDLAIQQGDIVMIGSDGLFDNFFVSTITFILNGYMSDIVNKERLETEGSIVDRLVADYVEFAFENPKLTATLDNLDLYFQEFANSQESDENLLEDLESWDYGQSSQNKSQETEIKADTESQDYEIKMREKLKSIIDKNNQKRETKGLPPFTPIHQEFKLVEIDYSSDERRRETIYQRIKQLGEIAKKKMEKSKVKLDNPIPENSEPKSINNSDQKENEIASNKFSKFSALEQKNIDENEENLLADLTDDDFDKGQDVNLLDFENQFETKTDLSKSQNPIDSRLTESDKKGILGQSNTKNTEFQERFKHLKDKLYEYRKQYPSTSNNQQIASTLEEIDTDKMDRDAIKKYLLGELKSMDQKGSPQAHNGSLNPKTTFSESDLDAFLPGKTGQTISSTITSRTSQNGRLSLKPPVVPAKVNGARSSQIPLLKKQDLRMPAPKPLINSTRPVRASELPTTSKISNIRASKIPIINSSKNSRFSFIASSTRMSQVIDASKAVNPQSQPSKIKSIEANKPIKNFLKKGGGRNERILAISTNKFNGLTGEDIAYCLVDTPKFDKPVLSKKVRHLLASLFQFDSEQVSTIKKEFKSASFGQKLAESVNTYTKDEVTPRLYPMYEHAREKNQEQGFGRAGKKDDFSVFTSFVESEDHSDVTNESLIFDKSKETFEEKIVESFNRLEEDMKAFIFFHRRLI